MAVNRGKQFEEIIRQGFESVVNTSVIRLPDPTNGYLGIRNICDFVVYHYPHQYFIECKTVHGNTLPFSNITENQWNGMLEVSKIKGVIAGVICWWVDKDVTLFIPIQAMEERKLMQDKHSIRFDDGENTGLECYPLTGKKKKVFFEYDMLDFIERVSYGKIK